MQTQSKTARVRSTLVLLPLAVLLFIPANATLQVDSSLAAKKAILFIDQRLFALRKSYIGLKERDLDGQDGRPLLSIETGL